MIRQLIADFKGVAEAQNKLAGHYQLDGYTPDFTAEVTLSRLIHILQTESVYIERVWFYKKTLWARLKTNYRGSIYLGANVD